MNARLCLILAASLLVSLAPGQAAADDAETDEPPRCKVEKREVPDFDGRPPGQQARRDALWVPRVFLAPIYGWWEYLVRRPTGALISGAEKAELPKKVTTVLTFGSGGKVALYPSALVDFGFRPSVGASFMINGPPDGAGRTRLAFAFGGRRWWLFSAKQRFFLGGAPHGNLPWTHSQVAFGFSFQQRPDYVFNGIGSRPTGPRTRYFRERIATDVSAEIVFGELDGLTIHTEVESNRFGPGGIERDPSIETRYDVTDPGVAPRFTTGYRAMTTGARLALDSRKPRPQSGTGARLEPFVEVSVELDRRGYRALRYGAEIAAFADLGGNRVIGVRGYMEAVEVLGDGKDLPFTEYVTLGGREMMRGHPDGYFRGLSGSTVTLQYTWPIWVYLDGLLFTEVGGTFGRRFDAFDTGAMAMSVGLGVRSNQDRDSAFTTHIALGTSRFGEETFRVDSVRLVFGTDRGF